MLLKFISYELGKKCVLQPQPSNVENCLKPIIKTIPKEYEEKNNRLQDIGV